MKNTRLLIIAFLLCSPFLLWSQTEGAGMIKPPEFTKESKKSDTIKVPEIVLPKTTPQEAAAEAAQRVVQAEAAKTGGSIIYGHSMFADQSLEVFRTTDGTHAPDTYILGAGDELRITIFGASQNDIQVTISKEGYIEPAGSPKIFLQGLSLAQARNLITGRLSASYSFRPDQITVTIATARTMLVNIFGETKITGGFQISALNSVFNVLSAAGGPTDIGSVRNIQLIRGTDRKTIDLYAFMSNPTYAFQFDLQQNDIIFVPVVKKLVAIEGAVKRPMMYEMLDNESLTDLIHYAGGIKVDAYTDFVQIQRFENDIPRLFEWNLSEILSGKEKVDLQNGDIVRIKLMAKPIDQFVSISGKVYYPGTYDLVKNSTIRSILKNAQTTSQADLALVFVERIRPDATIEYLTVPWAKLRDSGKDFPLQNGDRIKISEQARYKYTGIIGVEGDVKEPFEKTFAMDDHLPVKDAIEMAGGLNPTANPVAYIFRRNLLNPVLMNYIRINLDSAGNIQLQPGDRLHVYNNTVFTNIGEVYVSGAVKDPQTLTYSPELTIRDLITTAGGLTVGAALNYIKVFRTILSPTEPSKQEMLTIEMDSTYQVVSPSSFILKPYDHIVVPLTPSFTLGRTIEIKGEVNYPGQYVLTNKQVSLSDVIAMAGGLLGSADKQGSRLFRSFNKVGEITIDVGKALNMKGNIKCDLVLMEGDVITIPRLENTVTIRNNGTALAEYSGSSDGVMNLVYQGPKSAKWYVNHFAGGFLPKADRNSVTVIGRNGRMKGTSRTFLWMRKYPKVSTGSLINVKMKPVKPSTKN